jgi:hypothetical protein
VTSGSFLPVLKAVALSAPAIFSGSTLYFAANVDIRLGRPDAVVTGAVCATAVFCFAIAISV